MKPNFGVMNLELQGLEKDFFPYEDSARFRTTRIKKFQEPKTISCRSEIETRSQICHSASTITLLAASDSDDHPSKLERNMRPNFGVMNLELQGLQKNFFRYEDSSRFRTRRIKKIQKPKTTSCRSEIEIRSQISHSASTITLLAASDNDDHSSIDEIISNPVITQKLLIIQTKISELLNEISYRLEKIPSPDGDIDLRRRQKCVMEFGIRFSRNYLYDLKRRMIDIQCHSQAIFPYTIEKGRKREIFLHMQTIEGKVTSVHQLLLKALIAYSKHIPCSVSRGQHEKLKEVLKIVIDLQELCNKINMSAENFGAGDTVIHSLGNDIKARCYEIFEKLSLLPKMYSLDVSQGNLSIEARSSVTARKRKNQLESRKSLEKRLSMYNVDPKLFQNPKSRRPVTAGTYSREQRHSVTYVLCSNPPPPPTPVQSYSNPLTEKSSKKYRKARVNGLLHEDTIRTTMELVPTKSDTCLPISLDKEYHRPTQLVFNKISFHRLIDYRNRFNKNCLSTQMNTNKNQNKPWEIIAWIADKLVDELLSAICEELRSDRVFKQLFKR